MSIVTVGIDLAKNVFSVHGDDDNGKPVVVKPKVARDKLLELVAQLPPFVIGMEACSGAPLGAAVPRSARTETAVAGSLMRAGAAQVPATLPGSAGVEAGNCRKFPVLDDSSVLALRDRMPRRLGFDGAVNATSV